MITKQQPLEWKGRRTLVQIACIYIAGLNDKGQLAPEKDISQQDEARISRKEALPSPTHPNEMIGNRIVRVAIAEDEMTVLAIYKKIFVVSGFDVSASFNNGKDLTNFVLNNKDPLSEPDVVIVDLRMPIMDGIESAKIIKAAKPRIKIILASAYDVSHASVVLFDSILRKPFGRKELIEAVSHVVEDV